jgi:hypothetical protein
LHVSHITSHYYGEVLALVMLMHAAHHRSLSVLPADCGRTLRLLHHPFTHISFCNDQRARVRADPHSAQQMSGVPGSVPAQLCSFDKDAFTMSTCIPRLAVGTYSGIDPLLQSLQHWITPSMYSGGQYMYR